MKFAIELQESAKNNIRMICTDKTDVTINE